MRELKFRAWDKHAKQMGQPVNLYRDESVTGDMYYPLAWGKGTGIDSVVLMQYIGLKDKNGVEIYEGDVVKYKFSREIVHVVRWGEWEEEMSTGVGFEFPWFFGESGIEVIGNVFENPELLTTKE